MNQKATPNKYLYSAKAWDMGIAYCFLGTANHNNNLILDQEADVLFLIAIVTLQ